MAGIYIIVVSLYFSKVYQRWPFIKDPWSKAEFFFLSPFWFCLSPHCRHWMQNLSQPKSEGYLGSKVLVWPVIKFGQLAFFFLDDTLDFENHQTFGRVLLVGACISNYYPKRFLSRLADINIHSKTACQHGATCGASCLASLRRCVFYDCLVLSY